MGRLLFISAIVMLAGAPLHAQEMPWCVELDVFTKNCGFTSHDECAAVATNAIGPATGASRCIRNPNYRGPAADAAKAKASGQSAKKQPK
jgi:hypothetical protein